MQPSSTHLFSATDAIAAGAQVRADGVRYSVWAPKHATLRVRIMRVDGSEQWLEMERAEAGYFVCEDRDGGAGDRYLYVLPNGAELPDPASRFQPGGVHG